MKPLKHLFALFLALYAFSASAQTAANVPTAANMFAAAQGCQTAPCANSFALQSGFLLVDSVVVGDGVTYNYQSAGVNTSGSYTAPNLLHTYVCADGACCVLSFSTAIANQFDALVNGFKSLGFVIDMDNSAVSSNVVNTVYSYSASQNFFLDTTETHNVTLSNGTTISVFEVILEYTPQ
jgi:outer membrane lipoprotein-sorting protein